ncbi:sensor histidine kinase [Aeribacillus composti]|uniref:histidine kinase n=1 Tax=Aeribacillus composti TaxID=1868734 RepID=A0ABY9WAE9_9BACI|nr:sensor histidine kinase [Aeribacillus composti]MDR9796856.1 sensor histidine kinase [Aeribacillus pallidus]MED1439010.1 sensor histidine kinase [Aeribacillus composti]WNF33109.1 sensor histidine kinase [Aeribacillus composti]
MVILNLHSLEKKELQLLVAMIILVPLAGEIKFYPFNEVYRVSFGPPTLFIFLLWLRKVPAVICGVLAGLSIVTFRVLLDLISLTSVDWMASIHTNSPYFFYYFTYALVFSVLRIHRFYNRPWVIGLLGIVIELAAGIVELLAENIMIGTVMTLDAFNKIMIIAIFRSFFVIGLFSMIKLHESKLREAEIQKRNEHMIMLVSNLYEESVLLKKSVQDAEEITRQSYNLYQKLQEIRKGKKRLSLEELSRHALRIAGEVHEIKKDNQRILSGLSKVISEESSLDYLDVRSLLSIIVRTHEKYAELLGKNIEFSIAYNGSHPEYHVYTFISIVNNLVANAVEAIKGTGSIEIAVERENDWLQIRVHDDGPGIPDQYKDIIFKPGFTLKFDSTGNSSTGIGLSYVKELAEKLNGEVKFEHQEDSKGATFIVRLPIGNLTQKR